MRRLFALLLFANIAWYAWTHWVSRPAGESASAPATGPRLLLAREAPTAEPPARRSASASGNCLSLGPFTELTDATRASALLRESRLQPRQRAGEGVVWRGFWVSLGGLPNRAAADGIIDRLRRFGIGDAYAMPDDGSLTTISLGLFSERARALRRMDDVRALGLEPRITERERKGTVYWIDVDVEPPAKLPDAAQLQGEGGRILRIEVEPCEP